MPKSLSTANKTKIKDAMTKMVALDMRPFSTIAGQGFQEAIQVVVDIAARYGTFDVKENLCDPTTVSRNIEKHYKTCLTGIIKRYNDCTHLLQFGFCFTTDHWSCKLTKERISS